MISSTLVNGASSLQLWAGNRVREERSDQDGDGVLSDMGRIGAAMSRDVVLRARQVIIYLRDDSLAVNFIKYRKFLAKTFLEQREREDFGLPDVGFSLITVLFFALSICADMTLATCYYSTGDYWFFALTLAALWIPLLIVNIVSLRWYNSRDHACSVEPIILNKRKRYGISTAWCLCLLMHILLMGQIYRSVIQLYYGMKAWQMDHSVKFVSLPAEEVTSSYSSSFNQPDAEIEMNVTAESQAEAKSSDKQAEIDASKKQAETEARQKQMEMELNEEWVKSEMELKNRMGTDSDYYAAYIHQDHDLTTLDVIDGFLHDGSQIILQMYIMSLCDAPNPTTPPPFDPSSTTSLDISSSTHSPPLHNTHHPAPTSNKVQETMSVISIVIALTILSWTYAKYVRAARLHNSNKRKINLLGMCSQFIWHMYTLLPRVTALAFLAASYGPPALLIAGGCHWLLMSLLVRWERSRPCATRPLGIQFSLMEFMATLVIGYIHIFSFFKVRDEPTRIKYLIYYSLLFIEDTTFLSLWYLYEEQPEACHKTKMAATPLVTLVILTTMYLIGVFYLILYYRCCHPNGPQKPSTTQDES